MRTSSKLAFVSSFVLGLALMWASFGALAGLRSDAPARVDAFTGVMDREQLAPGDPQALAKPRALRVAMVLSENTKKHVAWCEEQTSGLKGIDRAFGTIFGGATAMAEGDRLHMLAYDPKFVSDGVTVPLVQRFQSLKVVGGVDEFRRGGFDLMVLVDVSFVNTFNDGFIIGSKYETGTFINAYFIDPEGQLLGKVETGGVKEVSRNTFLLAVARVRKETLERYEAALNTTLGPLPAVAPQVAAPQAPPAAAPEPTTTVQQRLKTLDELVKQGLLTKEEAAAKRAEILKSL